MAPDKCLRGSFCLAMLFAVLCWLLPVVIAVHVKSGPLPARPTVVKPRLIGSCFRNLQFLREYGFLVSQNNSRIGHECSRWRLQDGKAYKNDIIRRFKRLGKGWLGIPLSEGEMKMWSEIAEYYPVAILPRHLIPIVVDKFRFKQFVEGLGYGAHVPKRYYDLHSVEYPCVVKQAARHGAGGVGVSIVNDEPALKSALGSNTVDSVLLEEFISSTTEAIVNVLGMHGAVVSIEECTLVTIGHNQMVIAPGTDYKLKYIKCAELPRWDIVSSISRHIVSALNFTGFGFIQLKYDSMMEPKFVEMNGRIDAMTHNNHSVCAPLMKKLYDAAVETKLVML